MRNRPSFAPNGVLSISTRVALQTIKKRYRKDKFSVETNGNQIRLLRQSRPLTFKFFLDLHYMPEECLVVGIVTPLEDDGTCEAQIILDPYGRPVWEPRFVTVTTYKGRSTAESLSKQLHQQRKRRIEQQDERKQNQLWDQFVDCASCTLCCGGGGWVDWLIDSECESVFFCFFFHIFPHMFTISLKHDLTDSTMNVTTSWNRNVYCDYYFFLIICTCNFKRSKKFFLKTSFSLQRTVYVTASTLAFTITYHVLAPNPVVTSSALVEEIDS